MRNLKKILSLVLAMMMVLSLMVTASATTFADDEDIDYKEAVEVLTGLGVINGVNGEFLPKEGLNREAAAKIVAYIKLGGDVDATTAEALRNPFSDVKGWSENVIKYCYSEGIVDGVGDGTFLPKDYLTGYAFAKMLLVAAGIDGEYTGSNWKLNIATAAKNAGFLSGLEDVALSSKLTREQACQMAFNALYYGEKVEKTVTKYVVLPISSAFATNGTAVVAKEYDTFALALADALAVTGSPTYMTDFIINTVTKTAEVTENSLAQEVFGMAAEPTVTIVSDIDPDTTPTSATYGKLIATDGTYSWVVDNYDSLGTVVGLYHTTRGVVKAAVEYSFTVDVYGMTAADWKAAFGNSAFHVDSNLDFVGTAGKYVNGEYNSTLSVTAPTGANTFEAASKLVFTVARVGNAYKYYPVSAIVDSYTMEKVNVSKNPDGTIKAAINGGATVYDAKINTTTGKITTDVDYSDIDWASYYNVDSTKSFGYFNTKLVDGRYYFDEVKTVTGTMSAIGASNAYVVLGGQTYYQATTTNNTNNTGLGIATGFGKDYVLFLDSYGDFFASAQVGTASVVSDVVYVVECYDMTETGTYGNVTKTYAQVVAMDGTVSTILVGVDASSNSYVNGKGVNDITAGLYTFADETTDAAGIKLGIKRAAPFTTGLNGINNTTVFSGVDQVAASGAALTTLSGKIEAANLDGTNDIRLSASTNYLFVDGALETLKTEVVTGGINSNVAAGSYVIATKDADGNYVASTVVISGTYTNTGVEAGKLFYATGAAASATVPYTKADGTTGTAYVYSVYNAATGEKTTVTATNSSLSVGFHTFQLNGDIYTFTADALTSGVTTGTSYQSKYGTAITTTGGTALNDAEAKDAVIVDLRTDAQKTASGVSTISSIDDMAYWTAQGKTVTFTALYKAVSGVDVISIIFVTGPTTA